MIAVALLPLCWAASRTFYLLLQTSSAGWSGGWFLPVGFLAAVIGFFLLPRAFRLYVLGHELSHALAGLMFGARVGKMKVGRDGGHVELSKNNFIISLAPYLFPFYTGLVLALWIGLGCFRDMTPFEPFWLGLVGVTWGFHITFTIYMLSQHQPDVQRNGHLFSYVAIYLTNLLFMMLWVILLGGMTLRGGWNYLSNEAGMAYGAVGSSFMSVWDWVAARLSPENDPGMQ